ncbi:hypothetical protein [Candidatus Avelusimicrobium caledoniensis]
MKKTTTKKSVLTKKAKPTVKTSTKDSPILKDVKQLCTTKKGCTCA